MEWDTIKKEIYYEDGSLRDIIADEGMTLEKWKVLCDFLLERYDLQVFCDGDKIANIFDYFPVETMIFDKNHCYIASFRVCEVDFNLHFSFGSQHLEFDFFPNDVDNLEKHLAILDFMNQLANALKTKIKLTAENWHDTHLIKV